MAKFFSRWGKEKDVSTLRRAYGLALGSTQGAEHVLPDLAEFCYAREPMPRIATEFERGRWIGRHDVWLRIQQWMRLSDDEVTLILRSQSIWDGKERGSNAVD